MKKYISLFLLGLVFFVAISVSQASFSELHEPEKYEIQYIKTYEKAQKVIGKEDAGRNIYVDGLPSKGGGSHEPRIVDYKNITNDLQSAIDNKLSPPVVLAVVTTPDAAPVEASGGGAGGDLASIRACESGGNYSTSTGNGYYGAYQFDQSTWNAAGGTGNPASASPAEQDAVAASWIAAGNRGAWPNC